MANYDRISPIEPATSSICYWQQLSEVLLADHLTKAGFSLAHQAEGPDFLIEQDGKRIWVEVITPKPEGIPDEWLNHTSGVSNFPHEAMLLRWTAAIKEKAEKLLGNPDKQIRGYIEKGIVANEEAFFLLNPNMWRPIMILPIS